MGQPPSLPARPDAPRKYALEPLARLRAEQAEEAARGFASAAAAREAAERRWRAIERSHADHEAGCRRVLETEAAALARGVLSAGDLSRAGAWMIQVRSERDALGNAMQRANTELARAVSDEAKARDELAKRHADSEILVQDRTRWSERLRASAEAKDDEAASDAWRPPLER